MVIKYCISVFEFFKNEDLLMSLFYLIFTNCNLVLTSLVRVKVILPCDSSNQKMQSPQLKNFVHTFLKAEDGWIRERRTHLSHTAIHSWPNNLYFPMVILKEKGCNVNSSLIYCCALREEGLDASKTHWWY